MRGRRQSELICLRWASSQQQVHARDTVDEDYSEDRPKKGHSRWTLEYGAINHVTRVKDLDPEKCDRLADRQTDTQSENHKSPLVKQKFIYANSADPDETPHRGIMRPPQGWGGQNVRKNAEGGGIREPIGKDM
ncbi:hypothetical protein DPMN_001997 [Dreissena polymorpha]|uniref:Uncharacterized protein n=1 Tax=Dreissena polymorpha TaxID=45954 RepID=A0A9D4RTG8_DREPO|nr:hypothetical protein DPMN_001997 [Dreissena polymorpha]